MLRPACLFCLSLAVLTGAVRAGDLIGGNNLFFIKRNKNANEVHYDARVQDCTWGDPAVDYYWRDLEEGPKVTSEIMPWEPPAYGFKVRRVSDEEITIQLNALPQKKLVARIAKTADGDCGISTTVQIHGEPAEFASVYVHATENLFGWPKVDYIDVLGYSEEGHPVYEGIAKTEEGERLAALPRKPSLWKSGAASFGRPQ
jgi:hypothetical protein